MATLCCVSVELEKKPGLEADSRGVRELHERAAAERTCRARRRVPSSIWSSRTVRSRAAMWSAKTEWRCSSAVSRECPVFDYKFLACGHNTVRGAAGAAVLNAELMYSEGMLD